MKVLMRNGIHDATYQLWLPARSERPLHNEFGKAAPQRTKGMSPMIGTPNCSDKSGGRIAARAKYSRKEATHTEPRSPAPTPHRQKKLFFGPNGEAGGEGDV